MAFKDMFLKRDDDEDSEYDESRDYDIHRTQQSEHEHNAATRVELYEPAAFEDAGAIATQLKSGRAAVVNLQRLPRDMAQRTIDFLTGIVFGIDGSIQKVGHNVILCTPPSIRTEGSISLNSASDQQE